MKKKYGFTLPELLGVIIVISLIALIVVPIIIDNIEDARKSAFKDSVYMVFSELQEYMVTNNLETIPEEGIDVMDMEFEKSSFISGKLINSLSGNIKVVNVSDGRYCAIGEKDTLEVFKGECDTNVPTCELKGKQKIGVNGFFRNNPIIAMTTMPVKIGRLYYGIGLEENYGYTVDGEGNIGTAEYQVEGEDSTTTVYCYIRNIAETFGKNEMVVKVDSTPPTEADFTYSVLGRNLTIVATGVDEQSGVGMYQFSIDNGMTWTKPQTNHTYVYQDLEPIIHEVKVRIYNGTYVEEEKEKNLYLDSEMKRISLAVLTVPTFTSTPKGWTTENVNATVHFENDGAWLIKASNNVLSNIDAVQCGYVHNGEYTCEGETTKNLIGGVWYQVKTIPTLTFTENGTLDAMVSDGISYKGASTYNIVNIDRQKPVAYQPKVDGVIGENGWYKELSMQIGAESSGKSGISNVYYCITNSATCVPTISATNGQKIPIPNNNVGQRICAKVVSGSGVESDIVCSDAYKVDNVPPTAQFTISGEVGTVTCSDNYEINPSFSGTSWNLTGTTNQTVTYTCKDQAGNTYDASRTYQYNSCKTGHNTCEAGYENDCYTKKCIPGTKTVCTGGGGCLEWNQEWIEEPKQVCSDVCVQKCTLYKACRYRVTTTRPAKKAPYPNACANCPKITGYSPPADVCGTAMEVDEVICYYEKWIYGRHSDCGTETVTGSECNGASSSHNECSTQCTTQPGGSWVNTTCKRYDESSCTEVEDPCATTECVPGGDWLTCKKGENTCKGGFTL